MTRRFIIRPPARFEVLEAATWYETHGGGSARRFLRAFRDATTQIKRNPFIYQVVHRVARRAPLHPFPYRLIYYVTDAEIVVISCFHDRRDPREWIERL